MERLESWLKAKEIVYAIDTPYLAPALIISGKNTNETLILSCDEGYGLTMVVYICEDYQLSTSFIANISHQYKNLQTNKLEKNLTLDQLLDKAGQTVDHNTVEDIKREVLK